MAELFLKALIVHLVADWFLQTDWTAANKMDLNHWAAWVHSGIHTLGFLMIFPVQVSLLLGFSHLLIDTRRPLIWLRQVFKQNPQGPAAPVFEIWQDQAAHIILLAVTVLLIWQ